MASEVEKHACAWWERGREREGPRILTVGCTSNEVGHWTLESSDPFFFWERDYSTYIKLDGWMKDHVFWMQ